MKLRVILAFALTVGMVGAPAADARRPGVTEKVSLSSDGSDPATDAGNWLSSHVSRDGRYIVFETAERLVPQDRGAGQDIYVRDRKLGTTRLVSVGSDGTQGPLSVVAGSWAPSITPDGRFVAFHTLNPLVAGDTNLASDIYVRDLRRGSTERVSVDSDGNQALMPLEGHDSTEASISDDGRFVAFNSDASDLVKDDTNGVADIFVHDRRTRKTVRVSVAGDGREAESTSGWSNISGNGRFVVFQNGDRTLDPANEPVLAGLYIRDLQKETTEWMIEGAGIADNDGKALSYDGRFLTFNSFWPWYVPNDSNVLPLYGIDTFVYDHKTKRVERTSVSSFGEEAENSSTDAKISGDGRFVSYESSADNLVEGDTSAEAWPNTDVEAFLHDRATGTTEMVSVTPAGGEPPSCPGIRAISQSSFDPAVSWDGRFVSFVSCADGLDGRDSDGGYDVFVRDRGWTVGVGGYAGLRAPPINGWPAFGRLGRSVLQDSPTDVAPLGISRGAEILWSSLAHRPAFSDVFIKIDVDHIPGPRGGAGGRPAAGDPSVLYGTRLSVDGASYEVRVAKHETSLPGTPVFGLFRCAGTSPVQKRGPLDALGPCREVARLRGGYGTVGENVVVSVPLDHLGASSMTDVDAVEIYTAFGTYLHGPTYLLDRLDLDGTGNPSIRGRGSHRATSR